MRWIGTLILILCGSCQTGSPSAPCPGDEQMGSYTFTTQNVPSCGLSDIPDASFSFSAKFCRFSDGGDAFVSIGGVAHVATWDGQTISASYSARRNFPECSCFGPDRELGTLIIEETLSVALLSRSQIDLEGDCTATPRVDPDAGIFPPQTNESGTFDAVKACGTLNEKTYVMPKPTAETDTEGSCKFACDTCELSYTVTADRGDNR